MAKIIGPGATSGKGGCPPGKSMGPSGPGGGGKDMTTSRGYESRRTEGLRKEYKESGRAENGRAGR